MEVKILNSNSQEDQNFINNDPVRKQSFEDIYNEWNKYIIEKGGKIRVRLPNIINDEKYKKILENIDGKYFSSSVIFYKSNDIFELFRDTKISIMIVDNKIEAFTVGYTWPDCFYISNVRSNIKGGCTNIISKLIDSWWDKKNLKFLPTDSNNDPPIKLHVQEKNLAAVGCYKKFGFKMTDEVLKGETVMILTKEAYAEKYLLPKIEQKLDAKKTHTDQNVIEQLNDTDEKLLEKTKEFMMEYCNENHPTAAGMIHKDGHIVYGLSATNPLGNDVHAEHSVISQARIYDKNHENYIGIVAMSKPKDNSKYRVKSPCGICRELLKFFYPNIYVIVPDNNPKDHIKILSKYLLPYPYVSTRIPPTEKLNFNYKIFNNEN
jgi:cytidine deaminase